MRKQRETLNQLAEAAEREIDTEFETASLAMMRAFEAFQRYEDALRDAGADDTERWAKRSGLDAKDQVAVSMHMILRAIGVSPTGPVTARVVRAKLDECDLERCVMDNVAHPPTRDATIAGLTALAEGRYRQMDGFLKEHIGDETATHNLERDKWDAVVEWRGSTGALMTDSVRVPFGGSVRKALFGMLDGEILAIGDTITIREVGE